MLYMYNEFNLLISMTFESHFFCLYKISFETLYDTYLTEHDFLHISFKRNFFLLDIIYNIILYSI